MGMGAIGDCQGDCVTLGTSADRFTFILQAKRVAIDNATINKSSDVIEHCRLRVTSQHLRPTEKL